MSRGGVVWFPLFGDRRGEEAVGLEVATSRRHPRPAVRLLARATRAAIRLFMSPEQPVFISC